MTPEQWARVEELYHAAGAQPAASRGEWLARACGSDETVRREVESLLAQDASSDDLLEDSALSHISGSGGDGDSLIGQRVGNFEILELIDEGGMGQVYRARDLTLPRDVAVKVIPPAVAHDPARRARFRQEAELLASLSHPHIAHVYAFVEDGGHTLLVMELVPGRTLAEHIARRMPVVEALRVAREIADALDAAHEQGVVHRDLKPANVKITPEGAVKVLDFGLAAPLRRVPDPAARDGGYLFGTAAYLSPERARGESGDRRGDIWAFGCVLFEMVAGRQAYSGTTVTEILTAILEREPDWTALPAAVPEGVPALLRRCLDKDPRRRLRDIGEARVALDDLLAVPLAPRPTFSKGRVGVAAAMVAIAAAVFVTWLGQQAASETPAPARVEFTIDLAPTDDIAAGAPEDPAPAASPEGTRVLFRTGGRLNARWWIRAVDSTNPLELPVVGKARLVQWSPDGTRVVWCSEGTIWTAAIAGGARSRVADGCAAWPPSWSRSGAIIFAAADETGLRLVPDRGGPVTALTTVDREHGENWHRFPVFLPDSTHYVFLIHGSSRERSGIYLGALGSSTPTRLTAERSRPVVVTRRDGSVDLVFVLRGNLVVQRLDVANSRLGGEPRVLATRIAVGLTGFDGAYSASDRLLVYRHGGGNLYDRSRLLWFDRAGAQIGEIDLPADNGGGIPALSLSADQQQLLFSRWAVDTATVALWSYDLRRNVAQQLLHDDFLSFSEPEWAPDAKSFVYTSNESGRWEMRERDQSGADRHLAPVVPYQYAASGRFLLVTPPTGSAATLFTFDPVRRATTPVPGPARVQMALSPDERWLAYSSREAGQLDIYVQPFPAGPPMRVSTGGGVDPRWRNDGRELYYINDDGWIVAVPFTAGPRNSTTGKATPLFRIPVPSGLHLVPSIMGRSRYAPADNGRRFLISVPVGERQEVRVVTNWRETLAQ